MPFTKTDSTSAKLRALAMAIVSYLEFNQLYNENCVIGFGCRFAGFTDTYEVHTQKFADAYGVTKSVAKALLFAEYSLLEINEFDMNLVEVSRFDAARILNKLADKYATGN